MAYLGSFMKYKALKPVWPWIKSNGAIGLPIYDFLLIYDSNHMSTPQHFS